MDFTKLLIGAVIGYGALSLLKPTFRANQGFFGFSGPQVGTTQDVQTPNCTPSNITGNGLATYCNPPGVECAQGVDCADARAQYCKRYARGGVCMDISPSGYSYVAPNQGLPGQGAITGNPINDILNSFGFNPYTQQFGSYAPSTVGYGYQPAYNPYSYNPYTGGFGGGYPSYGYGYGRYTRYAYAVTGFDKKSGHYLYG